MQPAPKKNIGKWILVAVGGILAVQVQSALWEWVFRPGISTAFSTINNSAAVFWAETNSTIYQNMARRVPHDSSSIMSVLLFVPLYWGIMIILRNLIAQIKFLGPSFVQRWSNIRLLVVALVMILGTAAYVEALQNRSTIGVIYFDQLMAIAAPYVSPAQAIDIKSRFAQMQHRKDFDAIEADLKKIILEHSQYLPPNPLKQSQRT